MTAAETLDLTPSTRILPMLGEIKLDLWQCLAELIDNPVDAFLDAALNGTLVQDPTVRINLPTSNTSTAQIVVRDNGPGMSLDALNNAVRAGWTSNAPMDHLGLYGMGFNIATARLANKTVIYTARKTDTEWVGVEIDFEKMRTQSHFSAPVVRRPKADPTEHGTIVEISNIKADQREQIVKSSTQSNIRKRLARVYSAMLQRDGKPVHFKLYINNQAVLPRRHCVWGEDRIVQTAKFGPVTAFMPISVQLAPRHFCMRHLTWLPPGTTECSTCEGSEHVRERQRKVTGWIGLQRYLHGRDFGIDFLRNGRKIEMDNKDLFVWTEDLTSDTEYPIDDRRGRGRIVGEIHLDHCRVTYTKDRFDRTDPSWDEMVKIVRGEGPLLPEKARELGYGLNQSPLSKIHSTFRRSDPRPAGVAGGWAKILVVKDNDLAEEMAAKFYEGDTDYESDEKWWRLVEEQDAEVLAGGSQPAPAPHAGTPGPTTPTQPPGFPTPANPQGFPTPQAPTGTPTPPSPGTPAPARPAPIRTIVRALSREYVEDITSKRFNVIAYSVETSDDVLAGSPWTIQVSASGENSFYFDGENEVFQSVTFTPLDALLAEIAARTADSARNTTGNRVTFAGALTSLRSRYAKEYELSESTLTTDATNALKNLASSLTRNVTQEDARSLFGDLPKSQQDFVRDKMLTSRVSDPEEVISKGRFLEYAKREFIPEFVKTHPELFFDEKYFSTPYETVDYGDPTATDNRKKQILDTCVAWLHDAVWLAETGGIGDTPDTPRDRDKALRALMSLHLIAREVVADQE